MAVDGLDHGALAGVRHRRERRKLGDAADEDVGAQLAAPHVEQPVLPRLRDAEVRDANVAERHLAVDCHEGEARRLLLQHRWTHEARRHRVGERELLDREEVARRRRANQRQHAERDSARGERKWPACGGGGAPQRLRDGGGGGERRAQADASHGAGQRARRRVRAEKE